MVQLVVVGCIYGAVSVSASASVGVGAGVGCAGAALTTRLGLMGRRIWLRW